MFTQKIQEKEGVNRYFVEDTSRLDDPDVCSYHPAEFDSIFHEDGFWSLLGIQVAVAELELFLPTCTIETANGGMN